VQPQTPAARHAPLVPRPPPPLSVAAVARKLGVAPATLRTWDRRYGIGPADHTPGRHRRYNAEDLARLVLMRDALLHGATPAAAATYALAATLPDADTAPTTPPRPDTTVPADASEAVLPLPHVGWQVRALARAATALDAQTVRGVLTESIAAVGPVTTWDVVVRPVLRAIAQRWVETGTGVEIEHLLSDCVTGVYSALAAAAPTSKGPAVGRPVLLAGMAGDHHRLPIVVLSATLALRGVACRSLGTDLPAEALRTAIRRTAPAALLLWSQLPDTANHDLLRTLPRTRPGYRSYVAGPGWADNALPPHVGRLNSLQEATDVISAVASA
jgi:methanogenic corrinoid protein MtbC1